MQFTSKTGVCGMDRHCQEIAKVLNTLTVDPLVGQITWLAWQLFYRSRLKLKALFFFLNPAASDCPLLPFSQLPSTSHKVHYQIRLRLGAYI